MILQVLREVFSSKNYLVLAINTSLAFLIFAALLPNTPLLIQLFQDLRAPLLKVKLIFNLLLGIQTNFTLTNRIFSLIIAILFGIYLTLFVYFLKKRKEIVAQTGPKTGVMGLVSGIFGVGCASCGSFILSTIFSTTGAAGIIAFLPLRGVEFAILSVVLLSFSIYTISKNIVKAGFCKIP